MSRTPIDDRTAKQELPVELENFHQSPTRCHGGEVPIGNPEYAEMLKRNGQLGCFYDRDQTTNTPTPITMNHLVLRECVILTLTHVLNNLLSESNQETIETLPKNFQDVETFAQELANGIGVALYMKLRSLNLTEPSVMERFYSKPCVPNPFEIPAAYAYAISTLGQFKVSGMPYQYFYTPVCSVEAANNYCIPDGITWSPYAYIRAMEYAKRIGMLFDIVEHQVKRGTSWWLLQPVVTERGFELQCPILGENFTDEVTLVRALFCVTADGGFCTDLVDLEPHQNLNFGSMLRNPTPRIDLEVFNGIMPVRCAK
ncbi:hypothetical protein M5689_010737 [Euphorbia peplus]|nr:hypothetical protein M5689_010737 [Euphorbia peplus]